MTKDIYAPVQDETIQIGQQTNTFSISLSDDVLASIKMSRVSILSVPSLMTLVYSPFLFSISSRITRLDSSPVG